MDSLLNIFKEVIEHQRGAKFDFPFTSVVCSTATVSAFQSFMVAHRLGLGLVMCFAAFGGSLDQLQRQVFRPC